MQFAMLRFSIASLWVITFGVVQAQEFQRECTIEGVADTWHKIELTNEVLSQLQPNMADLRIYSISAEEDSLEVPYFLEKAKTEQRTTERPFQLLNQSKTERGYFFTLKVENAQPINRIVLTLDRKNFDTKVTLEGSQNQQEWFTLLENYRITSIKNEQTDYRFTTLFFPKAEYAYYRIFCPAKERIRLKKASVQVTEKVEGKYIDYFSTQKEVVDKEKKQSVILVELEQRLPTSSIAFTMGDTFDFQRKIEVNYLVDSVKTETGHIYNYSPLFSSYLSSLEKNRFSFNEVFTSRLQIVVSNYDNPPLHFGKLSVKGVATYVVARFDYPERQHVLQFGNSASHFPQYEVGLFKSRIPENVEEATLGAVKIRTNQPPKKEPLFSNPFWIWGLLVAIVGFLAVTTVYMLRKEKGNA